MRADPSLLVGSAPMARGRTFRAVGQVLAEIAARPSRGNISAGDKQGAALSMNPTPAHYLTIAEIARRLGVMRHRVVWVLSTRAIRHDVELGDQHGYSEQALEQIRRELAAIDSIR